MGRRIVAGLAFTPGVHELVLAGVPAAAGQETRGLPPARSIRSCGMPARATFTLNVRDWARVYKEQVEEAKKAGTDVPPPPTAFELQHPRVEAIIKSGEPAKPLAVVTPGDDRELRRVLTELVKRNPKLRVIILADDDIRYELLQQVLIDCAMAKVKDFNFETSQGT